MAKPTESTLRRPAGSGSRPARQTRADEVYHRLRAEILDLNYQPGDALDEDDLARAFNVSRTPVREALRRLTADRLVISRPHRGAYVADISVREMLEFEDLCELIEPVAARRAAGRVPQELLDEIKNELDVSDVEYPTREDVLRYMKLDVRLHTLILDAAGNQTMRDVVTELHRRMNAVRIVVNPHRFTESIAEHRRIIAALESGDGEAACEAMRFHLRQRVLRQRRGMDEPRSD